MESNLLKDLNDSQCEVVKYNGGPSLVIAGAGSGKTRVLTYKIAFLIEQGMKPWNILALTFTNKAAREMKERIGNLIGYESARYLYMGTFHSIFSQILRREATHIGFNSNFTIYDDSDSRSLIKTIIKEMKLNDKVYKPSSIYNRISMAKNHLITPEDYSINRSFIERDSESGTPAFNSVYATYCTRCKQSNAMDFDDLLLMTYHLFNEHEEIRKKYADRFRYVLVDEYQDTNAAQQKIVWQITQENQNVFVVGDDAQSIYAFRGANIDNILNFKELYHDVKLFKLEQNYRSTQHIVQAANSLIRKNERQIPKDVFSRKDKGDKLILKQAYSDKEEAIIVCNDILRLKREDKCEFSDFAILYRTNAQSRSFEEAMRKQNIPYRIYGGLSFYQRKEIKDVIAYFRLVINPDDEEALKRIINYPTRGIGDTTITKISAQAAVHGVSLWTVIENPAEYGLNVNKGTYAKLKSFHSMITSFIEQRQQLDVYELGVRIVKESGISADLYGDKSPEALSRQENLEELLNSMQDFVASRREEGQENETSLSDFLQEVSLLTDLDSEGKEELSRVSLMTIHSAKGLEFGTVFIVGVEENIFPSPLSINSKRELEEERRLLYVAITRAERHCIITCAKNRWRFGKMDFDTPSRFIKDIDPSLIKVQSSSGESMTDDYVSDKFSRSFRDPVSSFRFSHHSEKTTPLASPKPAVSKVKTATSSPFDHPSIVEGNVIEHERFGIGNVIKVEGTGENTKATVQFKNVGTKQLLLKFARYKVIG